MSKKIKITGIILLLTYLFVAQATASIPSVDDLLQNFRISPEPVYNGSVRAYYPKVLKVDGLYYMFYSDKNTTGGYTSALANSSDGNTWNFVKTLPGLGHPYVHYDVNGHGIGYDYILWTWVDDSGYALYNSKSIAVFYSNDPYNFTIGGNFWNCTWMNGSSGYMLSASYGVTTVFYNPSASNTGDNPLDYTYTFYFDCTDGSNEATCVAGGSTPEEAVNGTQYIAIPNSPSGWDSYKSGYGSIIRLCGGYYAIYSGGEHSTREGIGIASSTDGITFTKYSGNPILNRSSNPLLNRSCGTPSALIDSSTLRVYVAGRKATSDYLIIQYLFDILPCPTPPTTLPNIMIGGHPHWWNKPSTPPSTIQTTTTQTRENLKQSPENIPIPLLILSLLVIYILLGRE